MNLLKSLIFLGLMFCSIINAAPNIIIRNFQEKDNGFNIGISNIKLNVSKTGFKSIQSNKEQIYKAIELFKKYDCNIVLFPEFSLTGYFWENNEECWKYMSKGTINKNMDFLKKLESMLDSNLRYIIFNNIRLDIKEPEGKFLNTTYIINKDFDTENLYSALNEENFLYDKNNLPGIENKFEKIGHNDRLILDTEWGKLGFLTCYDLQFPRLVEEYSKKYEADAIIALACSPGTGIRNYPGMNIYTDEYWGMMWDTIMPAHAFFNKIWMICCNTVGSQKKGNYKFWGGSGLWAPSGLKLIELSNNNTELLIIKNLNLKHAIKEEHKMR